MQVKLTKDEKLEFETLDDDGKNAFMSIKHQHRNTLMLKSVALSTILVETLDELEYYNLTRASLKQTTMRNNVQLNQYIDDNMKVIGKESSLTVTEYIHGVSGAIDKILE